MSTSEIDLVINTGPIIALAIGIPDLESVLQYFRRVVVPRRVSEEIRAGASGSPGDKILQMAGPVEIARGVLCSKRRRRTLWVMPERLVG